MAYQCRWLVESRVLYAESWGIYTIEELSNMDTELLALLEGKPRHSVYLINEITRVERPPSNLYQVQKRVNAPQHPAIKETIIVGASPLLRIFINSVARILRRPLVHFFNKLGDALAYIAAQDPNINPPART